MADAATKIDSFALKVEKLNTCVSTLKQMIGILGEADNMWVKGLLTDAGRLDIADDSTEKSTHITDLQTRVDAHMSRYGDLLTSLKAAAPDGFITDINFDSPLVAKPGEPWFVKSFAIDSGADSITTNVQMKEVTTPEYVGPFNGFSVGDNIRIENAEDSANNGHYQVLTISFITPYSAATPTGTNIISAVITVVDADGSGLTTTNTEDTKMTITRVQKA